MKTTITFTRIKLIWLKYQNFYMLQNRPRILGFQKISYSLLGAIRPMELFKTYVVEQRRQTEAKYHWFSVFRQWCCIYSRQIIDQNPLLLRRLYAGNYLKFVFTWGQFSPSAIVIAWVCVSVCVCPCVCINHLFACMITHQLLKLE